MNTTDTPISLLRLVLLESERECICLNGECLHCRIKAVLEAQEQKEQPE